MAETAAKRVEVRLVNLMKVFAKGVVAVDISELTIPAGEFVTLLGPSGCGKTTTLRLIAGLERPTRGDVYFGDQRVTDLEPGRRDVAMVFQNYALYPHMTVRGNLEYGLKKRRVPREEREQRIAWVSEMLQITSLMNRKPRELSGGQQQRVALGRAIVREPKVFLLDEPLSNLDAKLRLLMRAELIRLHHAIHATMVYVTHDQAEAMSMSDRIAIMRDGKVQQYATPDAVYNHPANMFVAGFIGNPTINFISGALAADQDGLRFISRGAEIRLPVAVAARLVDRAERQVTLGVRPEDVVLHLRPGDGGGVIRGRVCVVESLGPETIVTLESELGTIVARETGIVDLEVGQGVSFSFDTSRVHLFSTATGVSLLRSREPALVERRCAEPE